MPWWGTLLVSLVGAAGGVIGGFLSGRIGAQATLQAVREERSARTRVDYVAALGAFRHASLLLFIFVTQLPPERPAPFARIPGFASRAVTKVVSYFLSDRERAAFLTHPITLGFSRETGLGRLTFGITQSTAYEDSLLRRLDRFLDASSRVTALAPDEDLDLLARVEGFALDCVTEPTTREEATKGWGPLEAELTALAARRRAETS